METTRRTDGTGLGAMMMDASPREGDAWGDFERRMVAVGIPDAFISSFARYYRQLRAGRSGLVPESEIEPVDDLPDAESLADRVDAGRAALARTVVIKLNGGLGTSMGLDGPKSLLAVRGDLTFLDIIARQAVAADLPLVLMNSFATDEPSLAALARYAELDRGLPRSFLQHREPKIAARDLRPVEWPPAPELEWCPPGHGDLYAALATSGTLDALLAAGRDIAFVSNADNLGADVDLGILGLVASERVPFLLEAADRTAVDRKGGHLARGRDGRLLLRDSAQCPPADADAFQDIARHRFFNTNNLWVDLRALSGLLSDRGMHLGLPLIVNRKTVDPRDPDSPPVLQLETAMGAAIEAFPGARAVRVPRSRFTPVKTTDDLLAVRSDAYVLTADHRVVLHPDRRGVPPRVALEGPRYRLTADFDRRFPAGPPSLLDCASLTIVGDFRFGGGVAMRGHVRLVNLTGERVDVPDDAVLDGEEIYQAGPS